jgi:hypothetical protein
VTVRDKPMADVRTVPYLPIAKPVREVGSCGGSASTRSFERHGPMTLRMLIKISAIFTSSLVRIVPTFQLLHPTVTVGNEVDGRRPTTP